MGVAISLLAGELWAQSADVAVPVSTTVEELAEQLDAPQRATRVAAEQALLALGTKSLPELAAIKSDSAAVRESLRRIVTQIKAEHRDELFHAQRIAIRPEQTLADILVRLQRATGNVVKVENVNPAISLGITGEEMTFWQTIAAIADNIGADWSWNSDSSGTWLLVTTSKSSAQPVSADQEFARISAFMAPQRQNFNNPRLRRTQRVHCRVDVEPRMHLFFAKVADADFSLNAGSEIIQPFTPSANREFSSEDGNSIKFHLDFINTGGRQPSAVNLNGKLSLWCAGRVTPVRIPLKDADVWEQSTETAVITLESIDTSSPRRTVFTLSVGLDLPDDIFTSHRLGLLHQHVFLVGRSGQEITPEEVAVVSQGAEHTVQCSFNLTDVSGMTELVYLVPEYITERSLRIQISDVVPGT